MRRKVTLKEKSEILQRLGSAGCVVPDLAREYSISRSALYKWRRELKLSGCAGNNLYVGGVIAGEANDVLTKNSDRLEESVEAHDKKDNPNKFVELSIIDEGDRKADLIIEEVSLRFEKFKINIEGEIATGKLMDLLATLNVRSGVGKC